MFSNPLFLALVPSAETGLPLTADGHGAYVLATGLVAIALTLGGAAFWLMRRRTPSVATPVLLPPPPPVAPAPLPVETPAGSAITAPTPAFLRFLGEHEDGDELWTSFDQLLRETVSEALGATRIRCYHVRAGADALQPISQAAKNLGQKGPTLHEGLLGHVATTGREYALSDAVPGSLLHQLAADGNEQWAWIWPIRNNQTTIGLIAVGHLHDPARLTPAARQALGPQLTLCWLHIACLERLHVVQRTDQASGVLTRNDFFTLARHALGASYRAHEPVVVGVLALEGLRRLDDAGHWRQRDGLIEQIGALIAHRLRSDDLVGRFADDRFVVLLRRLDGGLGRLIADKLLAAATECCAAVAETGAPIKLRVGLVSSAGREPPLEDLLVGAFESVERARRQNVTISSDADAPSEDPAL